MLIISFLLQIKLTIFYVYKPEVQSTQGGMNIYSAKKLSSFGRMQIVRYTLNKDEILYKSSFANHCL